MAQIGVSELLLDPDFIDPVSLVHRTQTVNSFGKTVLTETTINTIGSVQPANGKQIERLPEALRVGDVRSFFIKAEIVVDSSTAYPDIIVFNGQRFQVQLTKPWLNWGEGWNEGLCIREKPSE